MTAIARDPDAATPGLRTLGTASVQAASGADSRFPGSGPLTVKASYLGTPGITVFYTSFDVSGNPIQTRTSDGVTESPTVPGMYFFDQVVSLDQFLAVWDENDGLTPASELIATRHTVRNPSPPTSVTAASGDTQATITFTAGDNGGSAITGYTVTATDVTNPAHGGQTQNGLTSGIIVSGLTNGESYTFTVVEHTTFGDSVASAASNSIVPAVVVHVPDAPTSISASATVAGQATISFTAPANNGGATITSYTVTAVDETTPANGGQTHAGNSPNTITGLVNADVYHFTVHATNSAGNSVESVSSNSVTIPSGAGSPVATFTYTQPSSSTILLDGTGSSGGTATWIVNGGTASGTALTLTIGPLVVGQNTVRLSMAGTAGVAATTRVIDTAWVGRPLGDAQHDAVNGPGVTLGTWINLSGGTVSTSLLPQWSSLPNIGPWRNKNTLNTVEGYPGAGDNIPRITVVDSNHISLLTRYGDWPQSSGGYRSAMEMTTSYSGTLAGNQFGTSKDINVAGNVGTANGGTTTTGTVRFHRMDMMFPSTNPGGAACPDATKRSGIWLYQNNAWELHAASSGLTPIRFSMNGPGTQWQWVFNAITLGVSGGDKVFDARDTLYDTWYKYIVEMLLSTNSAVGYVRLWRDVGSGYAPIVTGVPSGTILTGADAGKYFAHTAQESTTGAVLTLINEVQNYRTKAGMPSTYPDVIIHYANVITGPTMASVLV